MAKRATRESYGIALQELGKDKRIVVLDADLAGSTQTKLCLFSKSACNSQQNLLFSS